MSDISAVADWLRQRTGETDAAWIERLQAVFAQGQSPASDAKADRIGERLWKRFQAERIKGIGSDK